MSARDTFLVQSRQRPSTDQPTEVCGISLFVQVRLVRFPENAQRRFTIWSAQPNWTASILKLICRASSTQSRRYEKHRLELPSAK